MIFDTIRYGTFTADDFITAHRSCDFFKFTSLPVDLRKQFISDLIDKNPTQGGNKFKQAAIDLIDGKIIEDQFRDAYWKYRAEVTSVAVDPLAVVAATAGLVALSTSTALVEYYRPYLEQHAKHLNKVIQKYQS